MSAATYRCPRCGERLGTHGSHSPGTFRCADGTEVPWSAFRDGAGVACIPPPPDPKPCPVDECTHTAQACPVHRAGVAADLRSEIRKALLAVLPENEWDYDRERLLFEATDVIEHLLAARGVHSGRAS